jgi:GcrA cell cycle regulator
MRNKNGEWPQARADALRRLWADGVSATLIGRELGVTRSAVIGKAHRLDLGLHKTIKQAPRPYRPKKPRRPQLTIIKPGVTPMPDIDPQPPIMRKLPLLQLTENRCHWPIGDPRHASFYFCGADSYGEIYCPYHHRRAFTRHNTRGEAHG